MHSDPQAHGTNGDRLAEIFDAALGLIGADRIAFLDAECGENTSLRAELDSMLCIFPQAAEFMECRGSHQDGADQAETAPDRKGEVIGHYQLLDVIGEGGFGTVFRARQVQPVRRQVALKIIKLGMDTRQVIARFEAERQALAMMDHPAIAKVFDAGATESGHPYFVMEFVEGVPITEFCDAHKLDMRERLKLFINLCQAVQHAHQKGIIHRDIKPSNVLVAKQDGGPVPKIIDFGIAKATNAEQVERTIFTELRQIIGTPNYMSPEQAGAMTADVDTRSDIYSLGVLLYELLVGATPFDAKKLLNIGLDEMRRMIREEEPVKPSTRMLTMGDTGLQVAALRQTDSRKLCTLLRGDLDWIAMKCLEKDRSRRYASASELADDIQRFLDNEPVSAGPPTAGYRIRKFARRHRDVVFGVAFVGMILLAATTVSIVFAWREAAARTRESIAYARESEARQRADQEAREIVSQAKAIEAARDLAERRAKETDQVAEFQANMLRGLDVEKIGRAFRAQLRNTYTEALRHDRIRNGSEIRTRSESEINEQLAVFDQVVGKVTMPDVSRRVLDESVLATAAKTLEASFADQSLVQARLHGAIGSAYRAIGLLDASEIHYRKALEIRQRELGDENIDVSRSMNELATVLFEKGDYPTAEALCRSALEIQHRLLGTEHLEIATTLQNLATLAIQTGEVSEAEALYEKVLAMRGKLSGTDSEDYGNVMNDLAGVVYTKGDLDRAESMFREVLAIRRKQPKQMPVADTLSGLAITLGSEGKFDEAEQLLREAISIQRDQLGNDDARVAAILGSLASLLKKKGDLAEVESLNREALDVRRRSLGNRHPDVANSLNNIAALLRDRGEYAAAEPLYREAISILEEKLPAGHPMTANCKAGLGLVLLRSAKHTTLSETSRDARLDEAEALLLDAEKELFAAASPASSKKRVLESLIEFYEFRATLAPGQGYEEMATKQHAKLDAFRRN